MNFTNYKTYKLIVCLIITSITVGNSQYLWFEPETDTYDITFTKSENGLFTPSNATNPDSNDSNTNVSKFERDEDTFAFVNFDLNNPITDLTSYSITVRAYIDIPTEELTSTNARLRAYVQSSTVSTSIFKQKLFNIGQAWQTFTFVFDGTEIPTSILEGTGFDGIRLGFANHSASQPAMTYYIDTIAGTTNQEQGEEVEQGEQPADWLQGSWGVTFPFYGGERLDSEVSGGYNIVAGAHQLVDELPTVGHIITNLSYFAHSHYFTLSGNNNVNVATEIHPDVVPNVDNDELIFDVLDVFKNNNKKIILYISTNYFGNAASDNVAIQTGWTNYYTNEFAGDEYAAYENLVAGFIEQVKDYADGYWLDTADILGADNKLEDFVAMIKGIDPTAVVAVNYQKNYVRDSQSQHIFVDSDGDDDIDDTDYRIILHETLNNLEDFTHGHITPLGQGAPPNSFGYEEYTIPNMIAEPWSEYGDKLTLKHGWFPIRDRWHVPTVDLVFETEQAYRFVKSITDGGAAITFANTVEFNGLESGYMSADEMTIMKEINDRLQMDIIPDYEPYVRPEGAFLVGEELLHNDDLTQISKFNFYPNPVIDTLTITRVSTKEKVFIEIISLLGVRIMEFKWDDPDLTKRLNLSNLKEGIYFLNIINENGRSNKTKIIKYN